MAGYTIALDIVARNLAGSAFGSVFGNLTMLAMVAEQLGVTAGGVLTPLGVLLGNLAGSAIAFAIFDDGMKTAIDDAAQLEFQLARLQNATGANDQQFAGMRQNIQDVAGSSIFNTSQVAEAYTVMANNLIPVDTIINGLGQDAITLAEAMATDPVSAAQLLTQTFKVFSDQGFTNQQMIDMLTRAYHDGMPDVSGMASVIGTAGGNADAMGVSLRDLLAVADILSPAMGSISKAGTSLNYMMTNITNPTQKATAEFQKLGIITQDGTNRFYDAQGQFIGLKGAIDLLNQSLVGLNPEEKAQALDQVFNVRSGQGARILANLKDFDQKYNQIFSDLGQTGAAQEAANRLVDTWQGRLNELKTNIQSFFANIGQYIIGPLEPVLGRVSQFFDDLSKNKGLDEFLGHFLLAGTLLGGFSLVVLGLTAALLLLSPVLVPLALGFGGVIYSAAVVAVIWGQLQDKGSPLRGILNGIGNALGFVRDALGWVKDKWDLAWAFIQPGIQELGTLFQQAKDTIEPALLRLGDAFKRIGESIPQQDLDNLLQGLKVIAGFIGGTLIAVLLGLVIGVIGFGAAVITFFAGLVSTLLDAGTFIVDLVHGIGAVLDDIRTGHLDSIRTDWGLAWNAMGNDLQNFSIDASNTSANTMASINTSLSTAYNLGTSLGDGLFNGFNDHNHLGDYQRTSQQIAATMARSLKFQSPPKEGPLSDSDLWGARFMDLLTNGMLGRLGSLQGAVGRVAGTMAATPGMAQAQAATAGPGSGQTITVPVYLDGRQIAETTFDVLKGQLKGMGMSRLFK